ncbi:MAG: MFS transporter, partial [Dehalococcoidales bacterium]
MRPSGQDPAFRPPGTGFPVTRGITNYINNIRRFSRNARLYLAYSLSEGLGTGMWTVLFNLYLLWSGFDIKFIALLVGIDMLFHGLFAFPAGLIGDKIGRRKAFFLASTMNIIARLATLFTLNPAFLIILTSVRGMGEGFHMVAGAPFMMENSEPEERSHLFSINASFMNLSRFAGFLAGGLVPLFWAGVLGLPDIDPAVGKWALITSLPLTFIALIPLLMMREKRVELIESFKELFLLRNIVNFSVLAKLGLCSLLLGLSFGLMIRFFNIFFQEYQGATTEQTGWIMAIGSLSGAAAILLTPLLITKWGKVRTLLITQLLSVPFIVFMVMANNLYAVGFLFLMRGSFYSISMPIRNQVA